MKNKKIEIKQNSEKEVSAEVMAQAIIDISRAAKILLNGRLKREAVVALIHDRSKIKKGDIEIVLNNLERLEETWCRK